MTPAEGKKRIVKLLGPKASWRDNGRLTSSDIRAEAKEDARIAKDAYEALKAKREALYRQLLSDPEYVALAAETQAARKEMDELWSRSVNYRLAVGKVENGMFFMVKAHGDNWADLVRNLEAEQKKVQA